MADAAVVSRQAGRAGCTLGRDGLLRGALHAHHLGDSVSVHAMGALIVMAQPAVGHEGEAHSQ